MNEEFILVHKKILPDYFEKVIKARQKIEGEDRSITEVCKELEISRSTYYKYKDYIAYPPKNITKRAIFAFKVEDTPGVLSSILSYIGKCKGNILTINQDMPIHDLAYITLMVNIEKIEIRLDTLLFNLRNIENVRSVEVLGYE
ncbi:MAG: ACT domain-containing protein [Bacilli bacterium]|nr:ACT domain-containing protein [Erysipelotrichaceae bacterium]MDD7381815.1 ACT domain-containing protein [Bacillales bacterium]MDY2746415.1 ACT domain-containing protein [Bacilli bacterium]MDY3889956.1 ACT domain-containing protein [Bacilli bacterium]MDY6141299.1 ACT domain-containing protein [Bacilli bacterium]